jgi:lipopolysaccharide biosynthesis glycosyltransferase
LFCDQKIIFEINDTYDNIDKACKARLDLFNLPSTSKYEKILYLDTDILVKDDINKVFNVCTDEILYVLEEGDINSGTDFWGKSLFGNEILAYQDTSAFTSGILLFKNCEIIKHLFSQINQDMLNRPHNFHDQPYIVYNAFKERLYDNKLLKAIVVNNDNDIHSDKVIHHFPGGPGCYQHKIVSMTNFLKDLKAIWFTELNQTLHIEHDIWTCSSKMRLDIAEFFVAKKHYKIAEIGSHKGYTTKVLSKLFSKVYAVDNHVQWTNFNKNYNCKSTNIEYVMLDIYKNSWDILPDDIEVAFIDADHSYQGCKSDIVNSMQRFSNLKYIIFDDYGVWAGVKQIIDELINSKSLKLEKFIGITDVPGPCGIVRNVNEGVICSVLH